MNVSRKPAEPASARRIAFDILRRVETAGAFASVLLDQPASRPSDPREAALVHEMVLGVLRRRAVLDHVVAGVSSRPPASMDPEVRIALRLGAYSLLYLDRVPDFAAVDRAVELVKRSGRPAAAGFVNGILRTLARRGRSVLPPPPREGDVAELALHHSHPRWWVERFVNRAGWDRTVDLLERNNLPAGTVLRPNRERATTESLVRHLAAEGVECQPGRFVPDAVRFGRGSLSRTSVLREGLAWVQDEAAQLVPAMFGDSLGDRVLDLCAAPGGKTMQLAERLGAGAVLVATDRHYGRLRRLRKRASTLGRIAAAQLVVADMARDDPPVRGPFDEILVDAPCSGTGTLRRHPEIRWRLRESDLPRLAETQRKLLRTAAGLLAPNGRIVYAVCSVEPEEGERQVAGFLERFPEFTVAAPGPGFPDEARGLLDERSFLRTLPSDGDLDGFFAALLTNACD